MRRVARLHGALEETRSGRELRAFQVSLLVLAGASSLVVMATGNGSTESVLFFVLVLGFSLILGALVEPRKVP